MTVIDFWRCLIDSVATATGIRYVPIGRCLDDESAADNIRRLWANKSNSRHNDIALPSCHAVDFAIFADREGAGDSRGAKLKAIRVGERG